MRMMNSCSTQSLVQVPMKKGTLGTYMDSSGNLVLSNPYELRPNYSYDSSGNIVRSGWMNETQKQNLCNDSSIKGNTTLYTKESLIPGVPVHQYTPSSDSNAGVRLDNNSGVLLSKLNSSSNTQSVFIKMISGSTSKVYFNRPWYWGPYATFDLSDGTYTGNAPGINIWKYGNGWWRIGGWDIGYTGGTLNCAVISAASGYSSDFSFLITCNMFEVLDSSNAVVVGSNTYHWPSSWVPYEDTRYADIIPTGSISNRTTTGSLIDANGTIKTADPYVVRPINVCSTSNCTNYANQDITTWITEYNLVISSTSIPSGLLSGTYVNYSQSQTSFWSNMQVKLTDTLTGMYTVSFILKPNIGTVMYLNANGNNDNHNFKFNSDGTITSDSGFIIEKLNNGYYYIENTFYFSKGYLTFGSSDGTSQFAGTVGNFRVEKRFDSQNYRGPLIESASTNMCTGATPTTTTDCTITGITYNDQTAWLIESPDVDQWSNLTIPHTNTDTSLTCVGSIFIKPLEDGTIAINNGTTYNSSFTFSNGVGKYNNDGGGNVISAGCQYVGSGVWIIYQVRNDGFIFNGASNIGLQNISQSVHFPKSIIYGIQLEQGSVPTSWIPYGQTRTAD